MSVRRSIRTGPVAVRRSPGTGRRGPRIRRASAGFGRTRSLGLLAVIVSGLAIYGAGASSAFAYRRLDVGGARFTDEASVRAELGIEAGTNLFALSTVGIEDRLRGLPAVLGARIEVALPDTLRVRLDERVPVVIWQVGDRRLLLDADGVAFAAADPSVDLPVVDDRRSADTGLGVGDTIDPVDFDAAARIGSLHPADLGSGAAALHVSLDDDRGFAVDTGTGGWTAVFGFYTPTLRTTALIPGQARLLRSLLAGREQTVETLILADDRNGTYTLKAKS